MIELANWSPTQNVTHRVKRIVDLFVAAGAAIGALVNSGQIKQIKKNIEILQEATILQGQKIDELARYADLTVLKFGPDRIIILSTAMKSNKDVVFTTLFW